ncbi:MAG: tetratricopeptide repeat protein [Candidatus Melainabacteria bacterium]|nr:tetratricopeptide repeat protein [Candidatus Melainabacteria bacterium]
MSVPEIASLSPGAMVSRGVLALPSLFFLASISCLTPNAIAADSSAPRVLQGGTEATEYILEGVPKYRDGMMAIEKKDYAAAEALFKASAAKLGQGQEKSRAECLYHQAACLELLGKADDASNVYKAALRLFERYDPGNPMRTAAIKTVRELPPEKTGFEKDRLMVAPLEMRIQTAIKPTAELTGGVDMAVLDVIDERTVPQTVLKSFVEMTCLETAELGANASNVAERWQPLMVQNEPAAFTIGDKFPTINVTVNKRRYQVDVNLPGLQGLHKILLVTNKEKICAIDLDSNESWLLRMKPQKDGTVSSIAWTKLTHVKPGQPAISRAPVQNSGMNWGNSAQSQNNTKGDWTNSARTPNGSQRGASDQNGYRNQSGYAGQGGSSDNSDSGF